MVKHASIAAQQKTIIQSSPVMTQRVNVATEIAEDTKNNERAAISPDTYGLINIGAICWFNSLIQSLMSVPRFIDTVRAESECMRDNIVLAEFGRFLRTIEQPRAVRDASPILGSLISLVGDFGRRQEDAHEGFHLLLDKMSPKVEKIFESLWRVDLYCDLCKNIVSRPDNLEKMIQVIMERNFIPVNVSGDPFEQFLSGHMTFLEGYKCPKCLLVGKAMRIARLAMPPDVLVVSFNKYMGKWASPQYGANITVNYMTSPKTTRVAKYELMAVIRHMGNMHGGHYNATGIRSTSHIVFDDTVVALKEGWEPCIDDYMLFYIRK